MASSNRIESGEKPGRREATERFAAKLQKHQGMSREDARKLARRVARRADKGAVTRQKT